MLGREVVRPAGVAATARAAPASSEARACTSGVPAISRMCSATSRRSSIGVDVPPVTPDDVRRREDLGVGQVTDPFDLDRGRPGDLAQAGQLLGVGAGATADDHHEVDVLRRLHRVLLPTDRDGTDRVDDLELVGAPDHERGELLELPGRLGRLADERHPLLAWDGCLPFLFLVHDDRVRREAEHPDHLGVLGGPEEHDRVALLDELGQLAVLLDDPGAGAVDDLETARFGTLHDVRAHAVGPDDDRRAVVDVVEGLDRLDAEILQVADDALVVDDLAEGMRRLAGGRGLLGLVDRFSYAITEPGALRDPDFLNDSHVSIIARGTLRPGKRPVGGREGARRCGA